MGSDKIKIFQIGLFDSDLSDLSNKLKNRHDFIDSVIKVSKYFLEKYKTQYVYQTRHQGILTYYKCRKGTNRIIISHGVGNEHKIVSFHFPFEIIDLSDRLELHLNGVNLSSTDLRKMSEISRYMRDKSQNADHGLIPSFLILAQKDLGNDETDPIEDRHWEIYNYVCGCEPGYLRYDHDFVNKNGQVHPEYHFDINFHTSASYKYGLYKKLSLDEFEQIFIKENMKMYVHPYEDRNKTISFGDKRKSTRKRRRRSRKR